MEGSPYQEPSATLRAKQRGGRYGRFWLIRVEVALTMARLMLSPPFRTLTCVLVCFLLPAVEVGAQTTLTFQQGVDGYDAAADLHLSIPTDFYGPVQAESQFRTNPLDPHWEWDSEKTWGEGSIRRTTDSVRHGLGDNLGLLRFDALFGPDADQIPPGATIVSATLELVTDNRQEATAATVHRVLQPWDNATIWSNFGPEPGPQRGVDFASAVEAVVDTPPVSSSPLVIPVTESVQAWSNDPNSNQGWLFVPFGARSTIDVSGSAIANPTSVRVDLEIDSFQRGELVVTLTHGNYTALLLNRIGRVSCAAFPALSSNDLDIRLDDAALVDVHQSGRDEPLIGTYRPDAFCVDLPLCTDGGTGGLCGQSPEGEWTLTVNDEWSGGGGAAQVVSWGIEIADGVNDAELYTATPGLSVPLRHIGSRNSTRIHSGEAPDPALRPKLTVVFNAGPGVTAPGGEEAAESGPAAATPDAIEYELRTPPYLQLGDPRTGDTSDQRVIAWQTIARRLGGPNDDSFAAQYRASSDAEWTDAPIPLALPTGSDSRIAHSVLLDNLDFDRDYDYRVTHLRNDAVFQSWESTFRTRAPGPLRVTAFGNSGQGNDNARSVSRLLENQTPDLHLLLGDAVYFHGEYEHFEPRISDVYGEVMANRPFLHAHGNHEAQADGGAAALDFFHMPRNGPTAVRQELNYSFDWGDVHFVSVNTGSELGLLASDVRPWLLADLAATDRRWKVLFTHEPPLALDPAGIDRVAPASVREQILSAAIEGGVDLFLVGGAHSMQRHLPLTSEDPLSWSSCPQGAGTTMVYAGTGAWFRAPSPPNSDPLTEPLVLYELKRGLVRVDADADELVVTLVAEDSSIVDEVRLADCVDGGVCSCDDGDGDGLVDAIDRCPAWAQSDLAQTDSNRDGIPDECQCGDATADGTVNSVDARLIQRCAVGLFDCPELCDVTGDGVCNSVDARLVQRFSVGMIDSEALRCDRRP